ncbi:MAG TPA: hypothetical protein VMH50_02265, partial [Thermoleophilia bacterium]|nr:hypothetical protein [Thermoleophilia bacterium]
MTISQIDEHLEREWEQAWTHYRHLESSRMQYLGFFFTVLLGAVTVAAALAKYLPSALATLAIAALTFLVFLLAVSLYISIRKTGFVLWRYSRILQTIRQESGHESCAALPFNLADFEECPAYISDPHG